MCYDVTVGRVGWITKIVVSLAIDAGSTESGAEGACEYHRIMFYGVNVMLAVDRSQTL